MQQERHFPVTQDEPARGPAADPCLALSRTHQVANQNETKRQTYGRQAMKLTGPALLAAYGVQQGNAWLVAVGAILTPMMPAIVRLIRAIAARLEAGAVTPSAGSEE